MAIYEGGLYLDGNEKIAILSSRFNSLVVENLVEGARDAFVRNGGRLELLDEIKAPGAYELPFVLDRLLDRDYAGICVLGAIIRGDTPHFDYISAEATKGIAATTLRHKACVSYGVLTTNTIDQALNRSGLKSGNKGFEAMTSLIELINLYKSLGL